MPTIAGILAILMVALLIMTVRLSNKIERIARGGDPKAVPTYANFFNSAFGKAGDYSAETRRLRSQLRGLLAAIVVLMIAMALGVALFAPSPPAATIP